METVESVPPTAMAVQRQYPGRGAENYVAFPEFGVLEWYTVRSSGEIVVEEFYSEDVAENAQEAVASDATV